MRLSELPIRVICQDASHHEEECSNTNPQCKSLSKISLLMLHLVIDLQSHSISLEREAANSKEKGHSFEIQLLVKPCELWL